MLGGVMRPAAAILPAFLVVLSIVPPALADAKLVLKDGSVLSGTSVERKDGLFLLARDDGSIVTVPTELVKELRLLDTGLTVAKPRALAGPAWAGKSPPFRDQIAAFGKSPYVPTLPPVDSTWRPTSDWSKDKGKGPLAAVRWTVAPMDSTWLPKSGFPEAPELRATRWFSAGIDPVWKPHDSWKGTVWFSPLLGPREAASP
jgi:hypothetical protein